MQQMRSQLLLQQLGIQQWIPRQQLGRPVQTEQLWRDGLKDEDEKYSASPPREITSTLAPPSIAQQRSTLQPIIEKIKAPREMLEQAANIDVAINSDVPPEAEFGQDINFDYQVLVHEKFIVFAAVTDARQQQLYHNLQSTCNALHTQLKWPLNIDGWLSHDGLVESYMTGFLALHQPELVILIGDIRCPLDSALNIYQAPSLAELLQQPLLKQSLWEKLYPLLYQTD